jgi:hypothetical protein
VSTLSQLQCQENDLKRRFAEFREKEIEFKSLGEPAWLDRDLDREFDILEADFKAWKARKERHDSVQPNIMSKMVESGNLGTEPTITTKKLTGAQLNPLAFGDASLKAMHKAFEDRQSFSINADTKAFSTVDSLLPAELAPGVVGHIHEWRILDRREC